MFLASFNLYEENSKPAAKQLARNQILTLTYEGTLIAENDDLFVMSSNDIERWQEKKKAA